jgi:hypothetical protein
MPFTEILNVTTLYSNRHHSSITYTNERVISELQSNSLTHLFPQLPVRLRCGLFVQGSVQHKRNADNVPRILVANERRPHDAMLE